MDTRRDFIFVDDLVDVVDARPSTAGARAARTTSPPARTTRSRSSSTRPSRRWSSSWHKDVEVRPRNPDDVPTILLDPSKTERDFDWRTTTPLGRASRRAIAYYGENGIEQTYTHLKAVEPADEPAHW